jgi:hypothetical protein
LLLIIPANKVSKAEEEQCLGKNGKLRQIVAAGAHEMRQAKRVCLVGLVALRRQRRTHMPGLQADDRETELQQFRVQRGGQQPG